MVWMGDGTYSLAGSLVTLFHQLEAAYPDTEWQTSGGTGTIGDAAHRAEGSASDHNPWLDNTVRAGDFALTARGPDCEALFQMVNRMYGAHDPRVYPYGYAVFNYRITDWDNPGGYHAQEGDPHTGHCHISVGRTGYNDTSPWPIGGSAQPTGDAELDATETKMLKDLHDRLGKIDLEAFNIDGGPGVEGMRTVLGKMRSEIQSLHAEVSAIKAKVGA